MSRGYDHTGQGVSNPALIWAVNDVKPITEEMEAVVRRQIDSSFPMDSPEHRTARAELRSMLFDDPMEVELLAA